MRRTAFKPRSRPMKRKGRLHIKGHSTVSQLKKEIQALLREIVILRDGGCILRHMLNAQTVPRSALNLPPCNGYRKDGELILQADHLITRSHAATYADSRLVVCVCKGHHGWKSVGSNLRKKQYDDIVRQLISPERVALWDRCEADHGTTHKGSYDWRMDIVALKQELKNLKAAL